MASKLPKAFYSETEAARYLGVSVEDFRSLLKRHIVNTEEDMNNVSRTTFHAADVLVLKLLSSRALAAPAPQSSMAN